MVHAFLVCRVTRLTIPGHFPDDMGENKRSRKLEELRLDRHAEPFVPVGVLNTPAYSTISVLFVVAPGCSFYGVPGKIAVVETKREIAGNGRELGEETVERAREIFHLFVEGRTGKVFFLSVRPQHQAGILRSGSVQKTGESVATSSVSPFVHAIESEECGR